MFGSNLPTGSGLFGLGTTLKRSQTLPLDSNATQAKPQAPSGGLFATTPATSAAAAPLAQSGTNSLIDGLEPGQPGLFTGFGQSTQPQQSGGLYSGLGASSQAQPLGNLGASSQPLGGGLFASRGVSTRTHQPSGLFAGLGASQPQQAGGLFAGLAASQSAAQQIGQHAPKQSAYFEQMVERGKKRNNMENGGLGELPRLQLGLADIARKARNLGTGGPSATEARADDTRA
jgi:nuclear pore complex protein Nup93